MFKCMQEKKRLQKGSGIQSYIHTYRLNLYKALWNYKEKTCICEGKTRKINPEKKNLRPRQPRDVMLDGSQNFKKETLDSFVEIKESGFCLVNLSVSQ